MNSKTVYALDANIISFFLKKIGGIDKAITRVLMQGASIRIAPTAYYEVKRGLVYVKAFRQIQVFEDFCTRFGVGKLDIPILSVAADIYSDLRTKGKLIEDADILAAAYCLYHEFTLVTNNTKHFINIEGLNKVDWANE